MIPVRFVYLTGIKADLFQNAYLVGSWDQNGKSASQWTRVSMSKFVAEDGCPAFQAIVNFDDGEVRKSFSWGAVFDGPGASDIWAIQTEVKDPNSTLRTRGFELKQAADATVQEERYYLSHSRRFGAQKILGADGDPPALRFSVWAPNAGTVDVIFGSWDTGYIDDAGGGTDPSIPAVPLRNDGTDIWQSDLAISPQLKDYVRFDHAPYMFRVVTAQGKTVYRTDVFSRFQIGSGSFDPRGAPYHQPVTELDGRVSCSAVIDPDSVAGQLKPVEWPADRPLFVPAEEFWRTEFDHERPLPRSIEDLVIYEMHIASLGFGRAGPGDFADAIDLLDKYLVPLGVNAIELLPVADSDGENEWGYGNTHHFAVEYRTGGRDHLKHFVRACHQRGIAVIVDVVYNHFSPNRERAEGNYDSDAPNEDIYLWYEGLPQQYAKPDGGYLQNGSTDRVPCYWREYVRNMFVSSAIALLEEFHVDGFRVDLTQAIHLDCQVEETGMPVASANAFGAKLLREWTRTLKCIRPSVFLIAEEHEDRIGITTPLDAGGFGFDATWFVDMYHNVVGVAGDQWAGVVARAGIGNDNDLRFDWLAAALAWTGNNAVSYHISHDECGNSGSGEADPDLRSHRTLVQAVHGAPYVDANRPYAESRARFAFGLSVLSAGTPMLFMGEEIGAQQDFKYNDFLGRREDLLGARAGSGAHLFRFYSDLIAFRKNSPAARSKSIRIVHHRDKERMIVFRRTAAHEDLLIFATLSNSSYANGYWIYGDDIPDADWREVFNSASSFYGGDGVGNRSGTIASRGGYIGPVVPANGFVVLRRA